MAPVSSHTQFFPSKVKHYTFSSTMMIWRSVIPSVLNDQCTRQVHALLVQLLILYTFSIMPSGCFYYVLGNISPKYRSRLSLIQLVALVKTKHIKEHSMNVILEPIVADIKKLVSPKQKACYHSVSLLYIITGKAGTHLTYMVIANSTLEQLLQFLSIILVATPQVDSRRDQLHIEAVVIVWQHLRK